jgi:cellulose synthase (UDP-forming)
VGPDPSARDDDLVARETERVLAECREQAASLLSDNREQLQAIACGLLAEETIDSATFLGLIGLSPPLRDAGAKSDCEPFQHQSEPVLSPAGRTRFWALACIWAVVSASFWAWWLGCQPPQASWLYWCQTTALFYQAALLPTIYWWFVRRMRRPIEPEPEQGIKVAMITLCVPSEESLDVIRRQLDALAAVEHPHDSWILDEGAMPEIRELARERGINYFTRRGVALYNQPAPPFQVATKAGNVNAWLDHVATLGLEYDAFVQLDIDHRPRPDYLNRTLGYFRDPKIAWVQAPSVSDNLDRWTARGLAEQDLVFHGPLQMGFYGRTGTPFIIGSHTSYRMAAVREIGGFQPTRAEDHLDTVVLAGAGYEGVFVPDLIAVGQGPHDLATYLRQQFAWAYSMIGIFLHHMPRMVGKYSPKRVFQFLFCQSWYTFWSVSLAVLWLLPSLALALHRPIASVKLSEFLVYFLPVVLVSSVMWCETRRWFQPHGLRMSWRGIVLEIARWPVVLWALINAALRIKRPYMITPKGVGGPVAKARGLYAPAFALTLIPLAAVWIFQADAQSGDVHGYYGLAIVNSLMGLILLAVSALAELGHLIAELGLVKALRHRGMVIVGVAATAGLVAIATATVWSTTVQAIS